MLATPVLVVVVYLAVATLVGSALGRRAHGGRDWAVAGGGMGLAMLTVGVAGTRIGGAGVYGVAGDVLTGGVWNIPWYALSTFLALALMGGLFAVPYRRLGLQTVGEAFTRRFEARRGQVLTSLCVQAEYLVVNVIEVYLTAALLRFLTGMPLEAALLVAALVLVTYTALGGLWGAAFTNLIHCAVIFVGLGTVLLLGVERLGGMAEVVAGVSRQLGAAGRDEARFWSLTGPGAGPILAMVFSAAIHTPAASIYANFSSAARSERLLRPGFLLAGLIAGCMPMLAGSIGVLTLAQYGPSRGLSGYASITTFATEISPWVGSAAVAAILAAVISTGGPILLSSATLFVRDWIPASARWPSARRLRAYRLTTAGYGLLAAFLALGAARSGVSLLALLLLGYAMVVPPAIALGYLIYWRGTSEAGAFWGTALGFAGGVAGYLLARDVVDPSYVTTFVPLLAVPILSRLIPDRSSEDAARQQRFSRLLSGEQAWSEEP